MRNADTGGFFLMPTLSTQAIIADVVVFMRQLADEMEQFNSTEALFMQEISGLRNWADALEAAHQETEQKQDFTRVDESSPIAPGRATAAKSGGGTDDLREAVDAWSELPFEKWREISGRTTR
jgi:hypothetical protein